MTGQPPAAGPDALLWLSTGETGGRFLVRLRSRTANPIPESIAATAAVSNSFPIQISRIARAYSAAHGTAEVGEQPNSDLQGLTHESARAATSAVRMIPCSTSKNPATTKTIEATAEIRRALSDTV
jgi:hypothetical protein